MYAEVKALTTLCVTAEFCNTSVYRELLIFLHQQHHFNLICWPSFIFVASFSACLCFALLQSFNASYSSEMFRFVPILSSVLDTCTPACLNLCELIILFSLIWTHLLSHCCSTFCDSVEGHIRWLSEELWNGSSSEPCVWRWWTSSCSMFTNCASVVKSEGLIVMTSLRKIFTQSAHAFSRSEW